MNFYLTKTLVCLFTIKYYVVYKDRSVQKYSREARKAKYLEKSMCTYGDLDITISKNNLCFSTAEEVILKIHIRKVA